MFRRSAWWVAAVLTVTGVLTGEGPAATIQHVAGHSSGWKSRTGIAANWARIQLWPQDAADGTIGEFSKASLQGAIDIAVAASGGWDAKVKVTQVSWNDPNIPLPANVDPVVASVDLDLSTVAWGGSNADSAGNGPWTYDGVAYPTFSQMVLAGEAAGDSVAVTGAPWQDVLNTGEFSGVVRDIVIDVPESLIQSFLNNPGAKVLFVGAEQDTGDVVEIFYGDQWSERANIRVVIDTPPQDAPWIVVDTTGVDLLVPLTDPVATPQTVTVTDAGDGTLAWTATESPDVSWLTLGTPSGGDGGSFTIQIDVTGQATGTQNTVIEVADPTANNTPVQIPVEVVVLATPSPIIDLDPSALNVNLPTTASPPAIPVTVNNAGMATLDWAATVTSGASWLSVTDPNGSDGDAFTVNIDHTALPRGFYTGSIDVTDATASNSPQTLAVELWVRDQDANPNIANSYDDAWEDGPQGWVAYCRAISGAFTGTEGFAVHCGDSISYANQYGRWAQYGAGKTPDDNAICTWMHAYVDRELWEAPWTPTLNYTHNGWLLARYDMPGGRSFTAESSIRADQYIAGSMDLPSMAEMFDPNGPPNPDGGKYDDAQLAVLMLGTNDSGSRQAADVRADLETIADLLLANDTIVIFSTIPPRRNMIPTIEAYNVEIRSLAQAKKLPLIDFYEEMTRRRPGDSWDGTLMASDGLHPSAAGGSYDSSSDPYQNNGEPLSEVGYLLRCWLSVQKIKEVYDKAIADVPPDDTPPAAVSDLTATDATSAEVDLTWTAPGDDDMIGWADSYDLRYATELITEANWDGVTTQVAGEPMPQMAGTSQGMTVGGLLPDTTYYFAIKATDESSNTAALSNVASITTDPPDTTPPTAPTNLGAVATSTTAIELTWGPSSDAESGILHYVIYRGNVAVATEPGLSYTDSGLIGGRSYRYEVAAVNGAGIEGPRCPGVIGTTPSLKPPTDMIAYWPCDDGAGPTVTDVTVGASHGTLSNATWTTGQSGTGSALQFNGLDAQVDGVFNATLGMNDPMSVALWVYSDITPTNDSVYGMAPSAGAAMINIYASGAVHAYGDRLIVRSTSTPPAQEWYHLAYTFDGTTHRMYINGDQTGDNVEVHDPGTISLFCMGNRIRYGGRWFPGRLDDVRVYGRALLLSEIETLYQDATVVADLDGDSDADLDDYVIFVGELSGPNVPSVSEADFDNDNDVDLVDFTIFLDWYEGP